MLESYYKEGVAVRGTFVYTSNYTLLTPFIIRYYNSSL